VTQTLFRAPAVALLSNNLERVVHTHLLLSPSTITWYRQEMVHKQTHHTMH